MDDKRRIALVETKTIDTKSSTDLLIPLIRYQLDNHLGSAVLELDAVGAIISYGEYYPYGSTSYQAGRNAAEVSLKRYRYTGKERDEETGLYYYGARYYAAWLGRWVSCDPKGMVDGSNLYDFVNNNSVKQVDQQGYQGEPWWKSMIMSIGTPFSHPPSEHDILRPTSPIYDVGATHNIQNPPARAVLNLGANMGRGIYNLVAMVVNLIPRALGGIEDTAKSLGASQSDIDPVKFAISMMGPGEIEGATAGLGYLGTAVGAKLTELTTKTRTLSETSDLTGGFANTAAGLGEVAEADIAAASPLKPQATTSTVPRKGTGSPGSGGGGSVPLRHGTTLDRAQNILKSGPDPNFVEPGGGYPAGGFATAPTKGPYPLGSPADYARAKAGLFPGEGGPAIVEVNVPQSIVGKALRTLGEVSFAPGYGLEELRKVWSTLQKTVKAAP